MDADDLPLPEALNVQYYLPDRSSGLQLKVRPIKGALPGDHVLVSLDWHMVLRVPLSEDWVAPIILHVPDSSLGSNGVHQLRYGVMDQVSGNEFLSEPVTIIIGPVST